ncbi:MAG: dihydrofolate reductase [Gammaproteobacteria bacterium]|nr:MAG: dihydrofolate reductase [Gammaproteobacteria bacterium]
MKAGWTALVAVADNGVIGRDNQLPWRLPEDLRRFRSLTIGHSVLMGRRTFESLGRPLPGRRNLVLTRDPLWSVPGAVPVHSLAEASAATGPDDRLFVIGGAGVYALCWEWVTRIELTEVHAAIPGDTMLRGLDRSDWLEVARERHPADERHGYPFSFVTLLRREPLAVPPV